MKKHLMILMVLLMLVALFAGCTKAAEPVTSEEPAEEATAEPTPEPTPEPQPEEDASFVIDFEDDSVIVYHAVNFDEAFTEECFELAPQEGYTGNAVKATVKEIEAGNTWWVTGMAFSPDYTKMASFKDMKKITFKYESTVDYSGDVPFIVQMVWKDIPTGEAITSLQVDFPIEKTEGMTRFEIEVPEEVTTTLNESKNFYFDWMMIGLEENADDLFNPGYFIIDDVAFYGDKDFVPEVIEGPFPVFTIDYEDPSVFTFKTVNFDEAFTEECLEFVPEEGFDGNVLKATVKEIEAGNTWWVTGAGYAPEFTQDVSFKDLKRVAFDYKSTVDYSGDVQFIVQMVWKDIASGEAVTSIQVDFPIVETSEVTTFEFEITEEVMTELNEAEGYYFDWMMVGLEEGADDLFNPGKIFIDNVSFYNE